ncbi:MAG: hypothetical protein U0869_19650 [Chloroflexota bacterium]
MRVGTGKLGRSIVGAMLGLALVAGPAGAWSAGPAASGGSGVAAAPTVSVHGIMGPCRLNGSATANLRFQVSHLSKAGKLKGRYDIKADSGGTWVAPCAKTTLQSQDTLVFRQRKAGKLIAKPFRTFKLPTLTVVLDRSAAAVTGIATGVSSVDVYFNTCVPLENDCVLTLSTTATPDGTGHYVADMPGNLPGNGSATIGWSKGDDTLVLDRHVPYVALLLGSSKVKGVAAPGRSVSVEARRGKVVGSCSGTAGATGRYAGKLLDKSSGYTVAIGDAISTNLATVPADARFTIPDISIKVTSNAIGGFCWPTRPARLWSKAPGGGTSSHILSTDASGAWKVDETVVSGTTYRIDCVTDGGDVVSIRSVAP